MPSPELENLVKIGRLDREPPLRTEFESLVREAGLTLTDSRNVDLALESRFRLAYGAVHSIAIAALRWHGYRPRDRQVVFQALAHTLGTAAKTWRMLARSHDQRNRQEYEGAGEIDERLLLDVIAAGGLLLEAVQRLDPIADPPRERT